MPDMSKPGEHLKDVLTTFECLQEEHVREARKHEVMASTYGECAHRLKRAIQEENDKAERAIEADCIAELN